jgi:low affinity Fe/Cu permease
VAARNSAWRRAGGYVFLRPQRHVPICNHRMRPQSCEDDRGQGPRHSDREPRPRSESPRYRLWSSRQLHRLGHLASHAWAASVALGVAIGWVVYGAATEFPSYWSIALQSISAIVTIIMLFAIQHLQARDQMVIHRKLDEMLRSLPAADVRLIAAEHAPDEHLEALTEQNRQDRFSPASDEKRRLTGREERS